MLGLMREETTYSHARGEINHLPCAFAKAIRAHHAVCELAILPGAGARAETACAQPLARAACVQLLALLHEKSVFSLGVGASKRTLTQGMQTRLQCGGLDGLKAVMDADAVAPDVHRLVRLAQERYGALEELPFAEVVKGVAAWQKKARP
jgi:hypothetical protein